MRSFRRILQFAVAVLVGINLWLVSGSLRTTMRLHSESAGCSWSDVIRARRNGLDPLDPNIKKAMTVVAADGDLRLVSTPLGNFWVGRKDINTLGIMVGEQQRGVYEINGHGVHPGDVVLDCGANVGVYTRHALALGAKRVVAVEPAPTTLECLRRNFAPEIANGKVVVSPKGVWNERGELKLFHRGAAWGDTLVAGLGSDAQAVNVPLTTVDLLVDELKLVRVDFIKIDIEGAEREALRGALATVNRFHPRLAVALEHLRGDAEEIPKFIRQLWPQMRTECGPCGMEFPSATLRVQPQVVVAY